MAGSGRCCVAAMSNHADARLPAFGRRREVPGYCGQSRQNEKAPLAGSPFSVSRARTERWRPRSATGRPAGAVADALRCGESATSNLAGARLSTSRRRRASLTSHRRSGEMKTGVPFGTPVLISLARPERFELPTFWFVGRLGFFRLFQINKLNGPPSPYLTPRLAESRREPIQPYVPGEESHHRHAIFNPGPMGGTLTASMG